MGVEAVRFDCHSPVRPVEVHLERSARDVDQPVDDGRRESGRPAEAQERHLKIAARELRLRLVERQRQAEPGDAAAAPAPSEDCPDGAEIQER
jgi:hypothetical protein